MCARLIVPAIVVWHLALALAASWSRLSPAERGHALPFAAPVGPAGAIVAGVLVLAAVLVPAGAVAARSRQALRAYLEALLMPGLLVFWLGVRPPATGLRPWDLVGGVVIVAVAWWLGRPVGLVRRRWRLGDTRAWFAGGWWRGLNLALVGIPLIVAALAGTAVDGPGVALAVLTYPFYALVQLIVVLALPFPRLARLQGPRAATLGCAACFAILHWPNPALMAVTAIAMAGWAAQYGRGRPLPPLAVSMGLAAALLAQFLPHALTEHMRVGAPLVRERTVVAVAERMAAQTDVTGDGSLAAHLAELYPDLVGRDITPPETRRWQGSFATIRRAWLAYVFLCGEEYASRFPGTWPAGEPEVNFAAACRDPRWRAQLAPYLDDAYVARCDGGAWQGYLACLYRDILRREPGPDELAAWSEALTPDQRVWLIRTLLRLRGDLARAPFDSMPPFDSRAIQ